MKRLILHLSILFSAASAVAEDIDYTQGVFIVNEDWYGHQNSTVNFLSDNGEWHYRVFQKENPGHELGCTTQFGTIYGGRFYFVSKQQQDPGATVKGSRFTVCDATTLELVAEFEFIATETVKGGDGQDSLVSIADGRSYLPVDEHKGYIGTSNGIWVFDSDNLTIGGQIEGTGNPNDEGYGKLYYAQIGKMIRANDYVFAVHQEYGLLVIDPATDKVVKTIKAPVETVNGDDLQRGFGSVVRSKDGNLWISMAENTEGDGGALDYMLKLNPYTFEIDTVKIPLAEQGVGVIPNSWYAWTADGFCASARENKLYWNGQDENGSWFTGYNIFCYDIDKGEFSKIFDLQAYPGDWRLYGTSFRIHPVTDEIYAFLYHSFQDPTYQIMRISNKGEMLREYPMTSNYWFPAIPVFPDNYAPELSPDMPAEISLSADAPEYKLYLGDKATDEDNQSAAIVKSIAGTPANAPFTAVIRNDSLILAQTDLSASEKRSSVSVQFNSNGKLLTANIQVNTSPVSNDPFENAAFYYDRASNALRITGATDIYGVRIFDMQGKCEMSASNVSGGSIPVHNLPAGIYVAHANAGGKWHSCKFVIKR